MVIPHVLDGAKVIQYTSNSVSNKFGTVGTINEKDEIIDELLITAMAICLYEGSDEYYLFSCDLNWEDVIGDIDSLKEVREIAKNSFNVNYENWITK
ncbi:hypothetical protein [Chengkuizengella marina]|uniref:Uncharacterized protein n=1 Tax=Chengkuizengella marina TaxID=2507566 RepID=A0A6N9PZW2_9BACL|nr:hypothetical protein [Chengkuizengella marina]NBI28145.1 hypothetical protein [Chengkuizengella marina]